MIFLIIIFLNRKYLGISSRIHISKFNEHVIIVVIIIILLTDYLIFIFQYMKKNISIQ